MASGWPEDGLGALGQHETEAAGTARKALADPNAYDLATLNDPQRKALIRFWEAWQEELKRLRILDPACGSGALLIEACNQLPTNPMKNPQPRRRVGALLAREAARECEPQRSFSQRRRAS